MSWYRVCEGCRHLMVRHRSDDREVLPCAEPGCECVYVASVTHYIKVTTAQAIRLGLIEDVNVTLGED